MRRFLFVMIMFIFLFSLTFEGPGLVRAAEPIKIGFMAPYVGVFAKFGSDLKDGLPSTRPSRWGSQTAIASGWEDTATGPS